MSCPPAPMCPTVFQMCQAPMVPITPRDEADCRIGCDYCGIADVPEPPSFNSCGVSIERCVEDDPVCIRIHPCNNADELVLVHFPYVPCKENCVNVTVTMEDPNKGQCDKLEPAMIILNEEGEFDLDTDIGQEYDCNGLEYFESVPTLEMIDPEYLPCAQEWYMQGDLVCYCPCDETVIPSSPRPRDHSPPPPLRKDMKPIKAPSPPPGGSVVEYKIPNPPPRRALAPLIDTSTTETADPNADAMTTGGTPAPLPTSESSCLLAGHAWDHDNGECIRMTSAGTASPVRDCPDGCYWNHRFGKCWPHVIRGNNPDCSATAEHNTVSSNHTGSVEGLVPSVVGVGAIATILAGISVYRYKLHRRTPKQPLVDSSTSSVTFCENPIHS